MRIYIRHAEKLYSNGCSSIYKHDPGIIPGEESRIVQLARNLISKFGFPTLIVCSPYLRTRQTATQLCNTVLSMSGSSIPLYCDVNLSEYLGNHPYDDLDVTPETSYYNPPHPEKYYEFNDRLRDHDKYIRGLDLSHNIWCITHGLVIRNLGKLYKSNYKEIETLGAYTISGDNMIHLH